MVELGWYRDSPISWYLLWIQAQLRTCCLGLTIRCTTLTFVAVFCIYERKPPQPHSLQLRQARAVVWLSGVLLVPLFCTPLMELDTWKSFYWRVISFLAYAPCSLPNTSWTLTVSKERRVMRWFCMTASQVHCPFHYCCGTILRCCF